MNTVYRASRFYVGRRSASRRHFYIRYRTAPGKVFLFALALSGVVTITVVCAAQLLRFLS
jgi:hypothetical protein